MKLKRIGIKENSTVKYRIYLFITVIAFSSCSSKQKDVQVEQIANVKYVSVTDSVYASLPSRFFYQNKKIYWEDATGSENFMHMIDATTGKGLYCFANKGGGPGEFTNPVPSLLPQGGICIKNLENHLAVLYKPSADTLKETITAFWGGGRWSNAVAIDDTTITYLYPGKGMPFQFQRKSHIIHFGHAPIGKTCTNGYDRFQGPVKYNDERKILVYCTFDFPYMAIYNMSNEKFKLIKEMNEPFEYSVNNANIHLNDDTPFGTFDMDMTKDYIVALRCDKTYENIITRRSYLENPLKRPQSVFVYNYNLQLVKIYNFPFGLLRIAGDLKSNDVYLIAMKPEYEIIKFKIS